jgi:hypothetical protein
VNAHCHRIEKEQWIRPSGVYDIAVRPLRHTAASALREFLTGDRFYLPGGDGGDGKRGESGWPECHFLERNSLVSNDLRSEYGLY